MDASAQADEGNITPIELQAELDTLRSLRRRSISQPSEGIDPDLPPSPLPYGHGSPPGSPTLLHSPVHAGPSSSSSIGAPAEALAGPSGTTGPHALGGRAHGRSHMQLSPPLQEINEDQPLADNLSELFWLPARLHPEIAPQEFRNFIRDQTRPENLLRRTGSQLGRRKSMLSRQYQPSDSDTESPSLFNSDNDSTPGTTPSISRYPSRTGSFRRNTGLERLTLADLQKLETIAKQAAQEGQSGEEGEAQLKRLVRRSLSLNPAAILTAADQLKDDDAYPDDDTDSPLIVPPPGSILRRSARTKIRKDSLVGDGGGHRFRPSRRGSKLTDPALEDEGKGGTLDSTRRHASIGSLGSVEDDRRLSQGSQNDRPISGESREGPPSPVRPQREAAPQAIPTQYVSPVSALTERLEAADLGPQDHDRLPIAAARTGADMPPLQKTLSPPQQQSRLVSEPEDLLEVDGSKQQIATTTGSLRTTKRIGTQQPPPPSKLPVRSATFPPPSRSPPPIAGPVISTQQTPEPPATKHVKKPSGVAATLAQEIDSRPALPRKASTESWQAKKDGNLAQQQLAPIVPPTQTHTNTPTSPQTHQARLPSTQKPVQPSPVVNQPPQSTKTTPQSPRPVPASSKVQGSSAPPKEKEKKSAWAKLGLSRGSRDEQDFDDNASIASSSSGGSAFGRKGKKGKKESEIPAEKRVAQPAAQSPEKGDKQEGSGGGGFFGGLFGKKKAEPTEQVKKEAAQAIPMHLQMPTPPPTASGMLTPDGKYINFYRLPIHIERAVYRLSHIKLANPRRPLYEQVLISNLMFWYLGVINKPVVPPPQAQQRPLQQPQASSIQQDPGLAGAEDHAAPSAEATRPPLMREASNGFHAPDSNSLPSEDAMPGMRQPSSMPRPLSHPPSIMRSDDTEDDRTLASLHRARPQTIPSGSQGEGQSPEANSVNAGFNEGFHVLQRPSAPQIAHRNGQENVDTPGSNSAITRVPSSTDDVHFDARRKTADLDTYDIISAYADEERRRSLLAQQGVFAEDNRSEVLPNAGGDRKVDGRMATRSTTAAAAAAANETKNTSTRSAPPRKSSFGASTGVGQPMPLHQHANATMQQHQHATLLPSTHRQMSKSPPPRKTPSPSLQTIL